MDKISTLIDEICRLVPQPGRVGHSIKDPLSVELDKKLQALQDCLSNLNLFQNEWNPDHSVGTGRGAEVVWIAFLPPGQAPSNGIYVCLCFGKTGNGLVAGCAISNTSKEKYEHVKTKQRPNPLIDVDGKGEGMKYNNGFVNPKEWVAGNVNEELLLQHLRESIQICKDCLESSHGQEDFPRPPRNLILFGPPGTGKTFTTVNKALDILGIQFSSRQEAKEKFNEEVEKGHIGFVTFHQAMSYEDFIEGIKPALQNDAETSSVAYEIQDGIFKTMCIRARSENNFDESYQKFISSDELKNATDENPLVLKTINGTPFSVFLNSNGNLTLLGKTGERAKKAVGTLTKERIRKRLSNDSHYWTCYYDGVIQHLTEKYELNLKKGSSPKQNYVLIIDEINRGNVANIFGELITLIEPDKREKESEALFATLPYSKTKFSVPNNLYIIGTMNTADRSVEALDTALRRRFVFEEMMPKSTLPELEVTIDGVGKKTLGDLLETINRRIVILKDRDHQIGHSYFMGIAKEDETTIKADALKPVFKDKIIPLLQEYFYDNYEKIQQVIGSVFVEQDTNDVSWPKGVETNDVDDEAPHCRIARFDSIDMVTALKNLFNLE